MRAKRRSCLLAATLLAGLLVLQGEAGAQSQTRSPAAAGDCTTQAGIGTVNWTNPGRAISSNNSYASAGVDGTTTRYLRCLNYGFTIPAGATILGIEVHVERKSNRNSNGGAQDAAMRLVKAGAIQATDRSTATTYTTTDTVEAHGSPTDLWGTTWTPAEINAADFGAVFAATKPSAAGASHTITVDHIQITVYFSNNPPPAPSLTAPADAAIVTTSTPAFSWTAVTDPDGDAVTYDIQVDDSGCGFPTPEINQTGLVSPGFTPGAPLANATYCWRARAVDQHGAAGPWSATRTVTVNAPVALSQTRSPAAAGDCTTQTGIGTIDWTNPGRAVSSNNSYASAAVDGTTTRYLRCLNYGFSIPAGATILGIEVHVERKSNRTSNGGAQDAAMRLVKAGAIQATDRSTATTYTTTDTVEAHGSPTDLWGTTWTPAEINAADFGAAFAATKPSAAGASHTITVDHIQITVYYALASVPPPGGFNAFETSTPAGAITGVIRTRITGIAFSLDVVAIQGGAQYGGFGEEVIVELLGNNALGIALDAQNCPVSSTVIQTVAPDPTIAGGRATVSFGPVADAWRDARVRVGWPSASPTVTVCSTDNFAIRPNAFAGFSVSDSDWTTAGTTRALSDTGFGAVVHKAGRPFSVRAQALNAAATPAVTANYAGTPVATLSACAGAACTPTQGALALSAAFAAGQLVSDIATYSEVGAFRVQLVDDTFASVDNADSTLAERRIQSAVLDIGRFVPDHFAVSYNTPDFATGCATGTFTYIGQPFGYSTQPVITVVARDAANNTTTLYQGAWWRVTNASLTGKSYTVASGAFDASGAPGVDPVVAAAGLGTGTLTFGSGSGFLFARSTPVPVFDAEVSLAINVVDADGVAYAANPARFGLPSSGNGIAFTGGKQMRFGRLRIGNANGSTLVPLTVPMEVQHWVEPAPGKGYFVTNADDACTSIAAANIAMGAYRKNLNACETSLAVTAFAGGRANVRLSPPGTGNDGSLNLAINLGAAGSGSTCIAGVATPVTGADRTYLQGNWTGGAYDQDPVGRATFGAYRGGEETIFQRENF